MIYFPSFFGSSDAIYNNKTSYWGFIANLISRVASAGCGKIAMNTDQQEFGLATNIIRLDCIVEYYLAATWLSLIHSVQSCQYVVIFSDV